jgi:NAD(P)-dependent dehydrogenase (short-subunit alcohol dehydrogenase family)
VERFDGKVMAVTGAAMGIGKGIAYRLAREGAAVAIGDVDEAGARAAANEIAEETGARLLGMKCDVTSRAEVDAFVAATVEKFGRLDVMVGNAGIAIGQMGMDTTEETWNRTMTVNGLGIVLSTQAAAREMIKEGHGGAIINLSSIAALNGLSANLMAYSASKAAVMQLSRCFALELAPHRIRVNSIAPGLVDTAIWGKMNNRPDILDLGMRDAMANSVPLGRMATPEDIAAMAAFLASDDAEYITGQIFPVEGGRTVGLASAPPRR